MAERGDVDAAVTLGMLYKVGAGVRKDEGQAAKWLCRAVKDLKPDTVDAADLQARLEEELRELQAECP